MNTSAQDFIRLTRLVRISFQRLKTLGDELHADLGLNSSLRAILEAVSEAGPSTVPQIAATKSVSRQHIQKHVDQLIASGHVALAANPGHKRSPFVTLTEKGKTAFAEMKRREVFVVAELLTKIDTRQLPPTIAQMEQFAEALRSQISAGADEDE